MDTQKIMSAIEAILFSLGNEVEKERIANALEVELYQVEEAATLLKDKYEEENRGIRLIEIGECYQLSSNPEHYEYIQKIVQTQKQSALSSAALETLSIIAYNQPVTKSTIEFIRGVDCTYSVNRLLERNLIDECGRADTPGRPILYVTTIEFLRIFGLKSLEDLPPLPEKLIEDIKEDKTNEGETDQTEVK